MSKVKDVDLSLCKNLTSKSFVHFKGNYNLKKMNLSFCSQLSITDDVFQYTPLLEHLVISFCTQLTEKAFSYLDNLRHVEMNWCLQEKISDMCFKKFEKVKVLKMNECNQITITNAAFSHLKSIEKIEMRHCNQVGITEKVWDYLKHIDVNDIRAKGTCIYKFIKKDKANDDDEEEGEDFEEEGEDYEEEEVEDDEEEEEEEVDDEIEDIQVIDQGEFFRLFSIVDPNFDHSSLEMEYNNNSDNSDNEDEGEMIFLPDDGGREILELPPPPPPPEEIYAPENQRYMIFDDLVPQTQRDVEGEVDQMECKEDERRLDGNINSEDDDND